MATIYDVSRLAGVSLATVSRVMNKNASVTTKTRTKVFNAMAELDYKPNAAAKSLASNQTRSVGLLVSELQGPFFGSLIGELEQAFRAADIHTIIAAGHNNRQDEEEAIEFLSSRQCDALILFVEAVSNQYLYKLAKSRLPVLILGRQVNGVKKQCIDIDHVRGGYLAAKHLIEFGHKELGFVSGPHWKRDSRQRLQGFQLALDEYDIPFGTEHVFEGNYQESGGAAAFAHFYQNGSPHVSGLVCANDEMAAGVMLKAREAGIKIPEQLSIVGFDDADFSHLLSPALTTVRFPMAALAKRAANRVLNDVYGHAELDATKMEVELIQRSSVARRTFE